MAKRDEPFDLGSWCILRMASADTLTVLDYLARRGFSVWTPVARKIGRMPRTRVEYDKRFALMPSYVFAGVADISDIAHLAMMPKQDCPRFSMFRYQGGFPLVADDQLAFLRLEEDRQKSVFERWRRSRMKGPKIATGAVIDLPEGPFMGLSGTVQETQGQFVLVNVPGFAKPIKIASLLLADHVLAETEPDSGTAAKAA